MIQNTIAENQLLGALYNNPELFDKQQSAQLKPNDFTNPLRQLIFKTLENMFDSGYNKITISKLETYLHSYPNSFEMYMHENQGRKYLEKLELTGDKDNYNYAIDLVKKYTLLRNLKSAGLNVDKYYNEAEIDQNKIEKQNLWVNKHSLSQISNILMTDVESAINDTVSSFGESYNVGEGIRDLVNKMQTIPDYGAPMPIKVLNEALRGMRLGTLYIYSAATGGGKSRTLISVAASKAIGTRYDWNKKEWIKTAEPEPVTYIGTELQLEELQSVVLAFVSGISQDKIMKNKLNYEEAEILSQSIDIIEKSQLRLEIEPQYTLGKLEKIIKQYTREGCKYFFFDYIVATIELMEELKERAGMNLREDQILHMVSTSLKNLCTTYNIFIFSSTQLTSDSYDGELGVQSVRGSRALVDRADALIIGSRIRPVDKAKVEKMANEGGYEMPNYQLKIVKSRGTEMAAYTFYGQYNLGNMEYHNCFTVDPIGELVQTKEVDIIEKRSAF